MTFSNEKDHEVSSCLGLAHSSVHVLTFTLAVFDETEPRAIVEQLLNLERFHMVFFGKLLDELIEPNDARNLHGVFGTSTQSVFTFALSLPVLSTDTTS